MRHADHAVGAAAGAGAARVNTGRATDLRAVRFTTLDELLADVDRLAAAERAGSLKRAGNWTLGQALGHLATWAQFSYDGLPMRTPWFVKLILRMQKRKYLRGPLPRGVKIPRVKGGTLGTEPLSLDEGLSRYRTVTERLRREAPTRPSEVFGVLARDEWIALHLRHAELHLSFFKAI
jgi:hypothetical protein